MAVLSCCFFTWPIKLNGHHSLTCVICFLIRALIQPYFTKESYGFSFFFFFFRKIHSLSRDRLLANVILKHHGALQFSCSDIQNIYLHFYFTVIFHRSYGFWCERESFEVRRIQSTGCSSIPLFPELTHNSINTSFKHDFQSIKGMLKTWCGTFSHDLCQERWR